MSVDHSPGPPVVVVLKSSPPQQWQGEVVALRDGSIAVRVPNPPAPWQSDARYVLISGVPGSRLSAAARLIASNGGAVAFRLLTEWKPLDFRRDARFSTDLTAEVRSVLGNSRQPGRVIDISVSGAAVAVDARPGGSQVEIGIWANGYSSSLVCDVIGHVEGDAETTLRLRFVSPTPPQQAFLRQLVASLMEQDEQAS